MKVIARISGFVCSFAVIMTLLYFSIAIPAFDLGFYSKEYDKYSVAEYIKMEKSDLMIVTSHMLDYLKDVNDDLSIEISVDGVIRNFFNQKEIDHMVDVKNLFSVGKCIRNAGFCVTILFLIAVFLKRDAALRLQAKANLIAIAVLTLIIAVLGLYIYFDFNGAFNMFHKLFFSNDLWQLDPSVDLLINIVPLQFFMDITKVIAGIFTASLAALTGLSALCLFFGDKARNIRKIR